MEALVKTRMNASVSLLTQAKQIIFFAQGGSFYGRMLIAMNFIEAGSWCKTAATEGINCYYNPEFILGLDNIEQVIFVVMHELWHILDDHIHRCGTRDRKLWNIACDMIINRRLVEMGVGQMPAMGHWDERFTSDMTPEEVYEFMAANRTEFEMLPTIDDQLGVERPGEGGDEESSEESVENATSGPIKVSIQGDSTKPILTQDHLDEMRDIARKAMVSAAMQEQENDKNLPDLVRHLITELVEPVMDWRSILDAFERSQMKGKRTYRRPSRRSISLHAATGTYYAFSRSDNDKTIRMHIGLDASGSITPEMLRDQLSEVVGIAKTFPSADLTLFSFHDYVHNVKDYTLANLDEIADYKFTENTGSTNFVAIWDWLRDKKVEPKRLAIFTDGKPNANKWGDAHYCPTLFVIHSDPRHKIKPPFGEVAYYELPSAK